uniref:Uncharacterized protein n=1 Tax=Anopheles atroparvus TaxID=41427 RepID=A0A182JED1_ANOAO
MDERQQKAGYHDLCAMMSKCEAMEERQVGDDGLYSANSGTGPADVVAQFIMRNIAPETHIEHIIRNEKRVIAAECSVATTMMQRKQTAMQSKARKTDRPPRRSDPTSAHKTCLHTNNVLTKSRSAAELIFLELALAFFVLDAIVAVVVVVVVVIKRPPDTAVQFDAKPGPTARDGHYLFRHDRPAKTSGTLPYRTDGEMMSAQAKGSQHSFSSPSSGTLLPRVIVIPVSFGMRRLLVRYGHRQCHQEASAVIFTASMKLAVN